MFSLVIQKSVFPKKLALNIAMKTTDREFDSNIPYPKVYTGFNPRESMEKWYIYLHGWLMFYGKCREIYQSHGSYGNASRARALGISVCKVALGFERP